MQNFERFDWVPQLKGRKSKEASYKKKVKGKQDEKEKGRIVCILRCINRMVVIVRLLKLS